MNLVLKGQKQLRKAFSTSRLSFPSVNGDDETGLTHSML